MMLELAIIGSAISASGGAGLVAYIVNGHKLSALREKNRHELDLVETKATYERINAETQAATRLREAEAQIAARRMDADYLPEQVRLNELKMMDKAYPAHAQLMMQQYLAKHYGIDPAQLPVGEPTPAEIEAHLESRALRWNQGS